MPRRRERGVRFTVGTTPDARGRWPVYARGPGYGGTGSDGRPRGAQTLWQPTRQKALELKRALERQHAKQQPLTVEEALERYEKHLRSEGQLDGYITDALVRLRPLDRAGVKYIDEIERRHVEAHLRAEYTPIRKRTPDGKGWMEVPRPAPSVATRRGHLKRMRWFFTWCVQEGIRVDDPTRGLAIKGRAHRGKPQLTDAECWALDAECASDSSEAALAVHLVLWTAARAQEVLGMRVRDLVLDADPPRWNIPRSATKTDAGVRIVELPPVIATRLRVRCDGRPLSALVFPADVPKGAKSPKAEKPRTRGWLNDHVHAKCRDAQVSEVPTHGLRGSLATLLDQVALRLSDTSRALGHADSKVTEESYIRQDGRTVVRLRDIEARRPTAKDAER